jgi:hypothetical protein
MTMKILGDRRLNSDEMERFKRGDGSFQALPLISGLTECVLGNREPTLFELALVELNAKLEGLVQIVIREEQEIRLLKKETKELRPA